MDFHHQCLVQALKSFFHAIFTLEYICLFSSLLTLFAIFKLRKNHANLAVSFTTNSSKFAKFAASHLYLDNPETIEKHFLLGDGNLLVTFGSVLVDVVYCITEYYGVTSVEFSWVRLVYHVFAMGYIIVMCYMQRRRSTYVSLPTTLTESTA